MVTLKTLNASTTEVELQIFGVEVELFVEAEVGVVVGVEADGVAPGVAVRLVDCGQAEIGDIQREEVLIATELGALGFGQDGVAGELIGPLDEQRADLLEAVGRVVDIDGEAAVDVVDEGELPPAKGLANGQGRIAAVTCGPFRKGGHRRPRACR